MSKKHLLKPTELESITQKYWKRSGDEKWRFYLEEAETTYPTGGCSLLELEMAYASQPENKADLPKFQENTTLVILVGESLEPLFQSIWVHNPRRLVPVVNLEYPKRLKQDQGQKHDTKAKESGEIYWEKVRELLEMLLELPPRAGKWQLSVDTLPEIVDEKFEESENTFDAKSVQENTNVFMMVEDDPNQVFRFLHHYLRKDLLNKDCHVVVDITGAKKTMVAGAFMLAAFSETEICYIDTSRHKDGKPYGYSCQFRTIKNPLKHLSLQTWDQIKKLYEQYDFTGAINLLKGTLYPNAFNLEVNRLQQFLHVCQCWEFGHFREAQNLMNDLSPELQCYVPIAIPELFDCWPKKGEINISSALFSDSRRVIIYALDELRRAHRLQKSGQYRAAFTRAYAVYETLFNARLTMLYIQGEIKIRTVKWDKNLCHWEPIPPTPTLQPSNSNEIWQPYGLDACLSMQSYKSREILMGKIQRIKWKNKKHLELCWVDDSMFSYLPDEIKPGPLRDKRNLFTHSYIKPEENDSKAAICLAWQNFRNFARFWSDKKMSENLSSRTLYQVPDWDTLRDACQLHFIPVKKQKGEGL